MINAKTCDRICHLYLDGNSIKQIHKLVNVSQPTISKILKRSGIAIRPGNCQDLSLNTEELNRLYDAGMSTYELATQYKCSDETIRKHIVNMRSASDRNTLSEKSKAKIGRKSKENWAKPSYQQAVADGKDEQYFSNLSMLGKKNYAHTLGAWMAKPESRKIIAECTKQIWQDPEYRKKQKVYFQERGERLAKASKKALLDPEKRRAWINKIRANNANRNDTGWVSSSQKQLYYILNDSGIGFFEEGDDTRVGPFYVVDCIVPVQQQMKRPLIIEVNGEYWHSLPHVALKDKQKTTYVENNTDYDLLVVDELELNNYQQIKAKFASFGLFLSETKVSVSEVTIKQISESAAKMLYSIFHYSSTIRKGATTYGAFVNNDLVAAISYTYPLRKSSADRLNLELKQVMEISRLARKTNLICENFASWFIAKTIKQLPSTVISIISFSDHTFGHTGTVYKASNFTEDGEIAADYSYISINGQYHKKTIWDRSKRMKMTEKEYAFKHGLKRIIGAPKTRWLYQR